MFNCARRPLGDLPSLCKDIKIRGYRPISVGVLDHSANDHRDNFMFNFIKTYERNKHIIW